MTVWTHLTALLLCLGGFAGLALAMERHQQDLWGSERSAVFSRCACTMGWAALLLALTLLVNLQGWSLGLARFSGHTSLAAALVWLGLLVRERVVATARR